MDSVNCDAGVKVPAIEIQTGVVVVNLAAMLRWNLFTYRDLWIWLDEPFDTPPLMSSFPQLVLSWTANDD
ncbi:MAG: hypothetical protein FJY65_12255 [Calditrichaeota bacterium]|nr:hypothetical protein [Calditrichota bacterium]